MTRLSVIGKHALQGGIILVAALCIFFYPGNSKVAHAGNSGDPTLSNPNGVQTPITTTNYWPAIKQQLEGYTDSVYIPEDTARTLWNGTTGNGTCVPTVSGKVNGVQYKAGVAIPSTTFNALYYYLNYKDVRDGCGANPQTLVDNWVLFGDKRGSTGNVADRFLVNDGTNNPNGLTQYGSSSIDYVVPNKQKTKTKADGMTVIPGEVHSNGGMNREQEIQARSIANQLADHIYRQVNTLGGGTQIEMVAYATGIVRAYCDTGTFTTTGTIYRTAYGVFIGGQYSSAGATRALGLILDYLDIQCQKNDPAKYGPLKWVHVNANKWDDQWCQVVADFHEAYADPIAAKAGYGVHPSQGGKSVDVKSYYSYAFESDIITTKQPLVDGGAPVSIYAPDLNQNLNK